MAKFRVKRGQLDALWAYVKNKGEKGGIRRRREAGSSGDPHTWKRIAG
jgi:hypothetical protein